MEVGLIMSQSVQDKLKLTADQKQIAGNLQKEADAQLKVILNDEQKKQVKGMQELAILFTGGSPDFGTGMGANPVFRAYRYGKDYPGLAGRDLTPGKKIQELNSK